MICDREWRKALAESAACRGGGGRGTFGGELVSSRRYTATSFSKDQKEREKKLGAAQTALAVVVCGFGR